MLWLCGRTDGFAVAFVANALLQIFTCLLHCCTRRYILSFILPATSIPGLALTNVLYVPVDCKPPNKLFLFALNWIVVVVLSVGGRLPDNSTYLIIVRTCDVSLARAFSSSAAAVVGPWPIQTIRTPLPFDGPTAKWNGTFYPWAAAG